MTRLVILGALAALYGCGSSPTSPDLSDAQDGARRAGAWTVCEMGFVPRYRTDYETVDSGTVCADGSEAQAIAGIRRINRGTCATNMAIETGRYWVRYGCRKNIRVFAPI